MSPGHLGELTPLVPCCLVDGVLEATADRQPGRVPHADGRARSVRVRVLPSRVVVYLVLAMVLFAEVGCLGVWAKLTTAPVPSSGAITRARRRVGAAPLRALFAHLAGGSRSGAVWFGLRLVAVDGTCLSVPDSAGNLQYLGKRATRTG